MPARYRIALTPKARKQLSVLPKNAQERIDTRLLALAENPRPPGVKKLHARADRYRIRVGDYRVIYAIEDDVLLVLVLEVGNRREVHR